MSELIRQALGYRKVKQSHESLCAALVGRKHARKGCYTLFDGSARQRSAKVNKYWIFLC